MKVLNKNDQVSKCWIKFFLSLLLGQLKRKVTDDSPCPPMADEDGFMDFCDLFPAKNSELFHNQIMMRMITSLSTTICADIF